MAPGASRGHRFAIRLRMAIRTTTSKLPALTGAYSDQDRASVPHRWPDGSSLEGPSILELIRAGVLSADVATLLVSVVARRKSLIVVAAGSGVGKSTLLTALLPHVPLDTRQIVLRGTYEAFDFRLDPTVVPRESVLIINEISPYLPLYLWGPALRRGLRFGREGYAFHATAHAESVEQLIAMLSGPPLGVPGRDIASLGTVVLLEAPGNDPDRLPGLHRVAGVWTMMSAKDEALPEVFSLTRREGPWAPAHVDLEAVAHWHIRSEGPGADLADVVVAATTRGNAIGGSRSMDDGSETVE